MNVGELENAVLTWDISVRDYTLGFIFRETYVIWKLNLPHEHSGFEEWKH